MVKISPTTEAGAELARWAHEGVTWDEDLWKQLVEVGRNRERGIVNKLSSAQLRIFIQTFGDQFPYLFKTLNFDMIVAKYRLFDEIAMMVMNRTKDYGESPELEAKAQKYANELGRKYLGCAETTVTQDQLYDCFVDAIREE